MTKRLKAMVTTCQIATLAVALICSAAAFAAKPSTSPSEPSAAQRTLSALFEAQWQRGLEESPESASHQGDRRYNDRWTDMSLAALKAREAGDREAFRQLQAIDREALSPAAQLDYDVMAWQLERSIARQKYFEWQQPLNQRGGVQTADEITEILPFESAEDYRNWIARLTALPVLIEQNQVLLAAGAKAGNTPSRVLMIRIPAQLEHQVTAKPEDSPFYKPFVQMPDAIPAAMQAKLRAEAKTIIADKVIPAYAGFAKYFKDDYLPNTRETTAAADLPQGRAYYDVLAADFTTTTLTTDEIHDTGLREVARLRKAMEGIKSEVGFDGTLDQFFEHLRTDPRFFHQSPQELLTAYQALSKRIDPELVKISKRIPRLPYGVRAIPDNVAPDTTTAYYQPGALDGSRAGFYYVNLYKPEARPKWEMLALSLHEAVPGHHFQFASALELGDRPQFRRTGYFTAYGEGWALYAEKLGFDMGLYDDPYDRMGQLAYEMWRAVRLVVDTGLHAKGWSRDKAIDYFMANAPKTRQDVVNEIDRYIAWPGQTLAYKVGELKISELRKRAESELGERFDLRDFNDEVLSTGSVPLAVLERHIDAWIASQRDALKM